MVNDVSAVCSLVHLTQLETGMKELYFKLFKIIRQLQLTLTRLFSAMVIDKEIHVFTLPVFLLL